MMYAAVRKLFHKIDVSDFWFLCGFQEMLCKEVPNVEVLEPLPGVPFEVPILSMVGSK